MKDLEHISQLDWEKKWTAPFSFLLCSYVGEQYYTCSDKAWEKSFHHVFFVCDPHMVTCYQLISDNKVLGNFLVSHVAKDISQVKKFAQDLKEKTDNILNNVLQQPVENVVSKDGLKQFELEIEDYLPAYIRFIRAANYLPEDTDQDLIDIMEDVRMYSEPVYGFIDDYLRKIATHISPEIGVTPEESTYMTHYELRDYIDTDKIPDRDVIKERAKSCGIYSHDGKVTVLSFEKTNTLKKLILEQKIDDTQTVKGFVASEGVARGAVRVVLDPHNVAEFNDGDILVAEMTRPEYVPLMKRAGAIVTDAGGVLCHAAIVSRELGKPCVIGTQYASEVLKDGDEVEVDAQKGLIKKI
ncbi:hypothetical protein C0581_00835 [Candidatus Parcubacteria bacterium]|nr:MAG: hypothetical protein C0581_00835 [Candidatus Parcubacteria bacterium]